MGKFDGKLLVSDMDATLINSNHEISDENFEAIKYFESEGGTFTVASGRMIHAVRVFLDRIRINAPAIVHNGAKIYDFQNEKLLFEKEIERERKAAILRTYNEHPEFGIEIYSDECVYVMRSCKETKRLETTPYNVTYSMPDEIWDASWTKALIIGDEKLLDEFIPIYQTEYDTGYSIRSGKHFLDIVANGVSKGNGVKYVADKYGILKENIYTVGDNMNDYEMIKVAACGCAVENAANELKDAADTVVPSCDDNAIAYIINNIIK